jgi:hypothetical protein
LLGRLLSAVAADLFAFAGETEPIESKIHAERLVLVCVGVNIDDSEVAALVLRDAVDRLGE